MADLATLGAWRDALLQARFSGNRSVQVGSTRREYKTEAEMSAALAALEAEIKAAAGSTRIAVIQINGAKGF